MTAREMIGIDVPAWVRKVDRPTSWSPTVHQSDADKVFRQESDNPENIYSLYFVGSDDDLGRVAIGLNGRRDSLTESVFLLGITQAELEAAGLSVVQSAGETMCTYVNRYHSDICGKREQFEELCVMLKRASRPLARFRKAILVPIIVKATLQRCSSVTKQPGTCESIDCAS